MSRKRVDCVGLIVLVVVAIVVVGTLPPPIGPQAGASQTSDDPNDMMLVSEARSWCESAAEHCDAGTYQFLPGSAAYPDRVRFFLADPTQCPTFLVPEGFASTYWTSASERAEKSADNPERFESCEAIFYKKAA